jgi:hypothetical protein
LVVKQHEGGEVRQIEASMEDQVGFDPAVGDEPGAGGLG